MRSIDLTVITVVRLAIELLLLLLLMQPQLRLKTVTLRLLPDKTWLAFVLNTIDQHRQHYRANSDQTQPLHSLAYDVRELIRRKKTQRHDGRTTHN